MHLIVADAERCMACRTCELSCAVGRASISKNLIEAAREAPQPRPRVQVRGGESWQIALHCRHCTSAPCLEICSTGALQRDGESGVVFLQEDRCIGCWMCVMVCPFGLVRPNTELGRTWKCDGCFNMEEPFCVASCPTQALTIKDTEDDSLITEKIAVWAQIAAGIGNPWKKEEV